MRNGLIFCAYSTKNGRSDKIWTCDFLLPKQALYQAEPHPDWCKTIFFCKWSNMWSDRRFDDFSTFGRAEKVSVFKGFRLFSKNLCRARWLSPEPCALPAALRLVCFLNAFYYSKRFLNCQFFSRLKIKEFKKKTNNWKNREFYMKSVDFFMKSVYNNIAKHEWGCFGFDCRWAKG